MTIGRWRQHKPGRDDYVIAVMATLDPGNSISKASLRAHPIVLSRQPTSCLPLHLSTVTACPFKPGLLEIVATRGLAALCL